MTEKTSRKSRPKRPKAEKEPKAEKPKATPDHVVVLTAMFGSTDDWCSVPRDVMDRSVFMVNRAMSRMFPTAAAGLSASGLSGFAVCEFWRTVALRVGGGPGRLTSWSPIHKTGPTDAQLRSYSSVMLVGTEDSRAAAFLDPTGFGEEVKKWDSAHE